MKELYFKPIITFQDLNKQDVLCSSRENDDNNASDYNGLTVVYEIPGME